MKPAAEASSVRWGAYGIRRSSRRKTVAVSVDASEGVMLTAPTGVPVERLDDLVRGRATWIVDKLRQLEQQQPSASAREFVSGESVLYLGRHYQLRVDEREAAGPARMHGVLRFSWLVIQAPLRLVDYIVAHELVHLIHPDHTSAFWQRLEDAMPDYEARREALRRLGPELVQW